MKNKEKACLAIVLLYGSSRKNKRKRWMKEWMTKRERYSHINLLKEIALSDENDFCNYLRMDIEFNLIYNVKILTCEKLCQLNRG